MGYSITCLGTFCMLLRRSGKNIPGASGCMHRSFSSLPSGSPACVLMFPVPGKISVLHHLMPVKHSQLLGSSEMFEPFLFGGSSRLKLLLPFHWGVWT